MKIKFKSIKEIEKILTSPDFEKGMKNIESRNKKLLESTKPNYEAMNQHFTI